MKIKNKPYLDKTTIQITSSMQETYDRMSSRYGVTVAVSCGIALLNSLRPEDRERWVDEINRMADEDKRIYEETGRVNKSKYLAPITSGKIEKAHINPSGLSMDAAKAALGPSDAADAVADTNKVVAGAAGDVEEKAKKGHRKTAKPA
jgi:hypothetical protein